MLKSPKKDSIYIKHRTFKPTFITKHQIDTHYHKADMKYTLLIFVFLAGSLFTWGQNNTVSSVSISNVSPSVLAQRVDKFGKTIPHEKVFLHLDNTCYFLGDTLWYKAYVTRTDKQILTDLSKILYVEVLTPDGYVYERQQLELKDGQGHGAFVLSDSLYGGFYEVRAYTRWMLNFGSYEIDHRKHAENQFYNKAMARQYFRDYHKLYSRVIPVYDKPKETGVYDKDMTQRPMRRYFKSKKNVQKLTVTFYPEGGNLIAGATNRVAFEANDDEGRRTAVRLAVYNSKGDTVAHASCEHRGRGTFDLAIPAGEQKTYKAVVTKGDLKYTVELPKINAQGCALRLNQTDDKLHLTLQCQGITTDALGLTVQHNGAVVMYKDIYPASETSVDINRSELPTGVNQLTVFDGNGRVYASRLCFVNNQPIRSTLKIDGQEKEYAPYAPIQLRINRTDKATSGTVSVSVRDAATDDNLYDNGNILTEMLLCSELKGFVEQPGYYFESNDETHRHALDLLMLVQGWQRYEWRDMAGLTGFQLAYLPEKRQTIQGCVNKTISYSDPNGKNISGKGDKKDANDSDNNEDDADDASENDGSKSFQERFGNKISHLKEEVYVRAEFVDGTDVVEVDGKTTNGQFYLPTPKFYDYCQMWLYASKDSLTQEVQNQRMKNFRDEEAYPDYYVKLNHFYPIFVKPYSYYQDALPDDPFERVAIEAAAFDNRSLPTVTVQAKRGGLRKFDTTKPAVVMDAYEAYNLACDYGLMTGRFHSGLFPDAVATALVGDMGVENDYYLELRHDNKPLNSQRFASLEQNSKIDAVTLIAPPPVNLGGQGQQEKYNYLRNLHKLWIYTDYCPRERGSWKYTSNNNPSLVIDTRLLPNDGLRASYRDRFYILPGFATCSEFYSPDYSQQALPEVKDYRRTLLWVPDVQLNADGTADIKLFNNSKSGSIHIEVEGIDNHGNLLTGSDK